MIVDTPSLFRTTWPEQLHPVTAWREQLTRYNEWAAEQFFVAEIDTLVHDRAGFFDDLLQALWQRVQLHEEPLSLMAVGGFGRGTLHPGSDIDLLILFDSKLAHDQEEKISQFITHLWDMRIDVGHAVRTVADCLVQAAADITIATTLIESRHVTGIQKLSEALHGAVMTQFPWQSRDFYQAKRDEQTQKHQNFHGTSYNLEPNIKGSPGGLRDIQTIHWIAKQHFKTRRDESLVEYNYITADEFVELRECQKLSLAEFVMHCT